MQQPPVRSLRLCVAARTPARPRGAGNALGARGNRQALTIAAPTVTAVAATSTVSVTHDDAVEVLEGAVRAWTRPWRSAALRSEQST